MKNVEQARFNMVEQQIRPWNVLDAQVLDLLGKVRRDQFVPADKRELAFMDLELPLGHGAAMWSPMLEARALQSIAIQPRDRVLEVGSGSGYMTALLAFQAEHVTSVEIVPELQAFAEKNLAAQGVSSVTLAQGDAAQGWAGEYDAIMLTGSTPVLPEAFQNALRPHGRLFAIVGDGPAMHALLVTRTCSGAFEHTVLFETSAAPLINALQPKRFTF